jgi:hypothetical protein
VVQLAKAWLLLVAFGDKDFEKDMPIFANFVEKPAGLS